MKLATSADADADAKTRIQFQIQIHIHSQMMRSEGDPCPIPCVACGMWHCFVVETMDEVPNPETPSPSRVIMWSMCSFLFTKLRNTAQNPSPGKDEETPLRKLTFRIICCQVYIRQGKNQGETQIFDPESLGRWGNDKHHLGSSKEVIKEEQVGLSL